jgi:hypothetical protein
LCKNRRGAIFLLSTKRKEAPLMWMHEATVKNVSRAVREIQAFDLEGDYRPTRKGKKERKERGRNPFNAGKGKRGSRGTTPHSRSAPVFGFNLDLTNNYAILHYS